MKINPSVLLHALALLWAAACAVPVLAQTGALNDTGQTSCYDTSHNAVVCDATTTGNASALPYQDGRYGRDAAQAAGTLPAKIGGGDAGFDFSCVLWDGTVVNSPSCTSTMVANTTGSPSATPATDWACTKDNVIGLVWSLQDLYTDGVTASAAGFANLGHNSVARCGYSSGWRLPSRIELAGIAHRGRTGPSIDTAYFPGAHSANYWASETDTRSTSRAWMVQFLFGEHLAANKTDSNYVRLVRNVP
jgi:hypothetical protein